jgi:hypothetical protein
MSSREFTVSQERCGTRELEDYFKSRDGLKPFV